MDHWQRVWHASKDILPFRDGSAMLDAVKMAEQDNNKHDWGTLYLKKKP